jgi:hypothetical protein
MVKSVMKNCMKAEIYGPVLVVQVLVAMGFWIDDP